MAHYAFLDENNIVTSVIVGNDENALDNLPDNFDSWEAYYESIKGETCKRTSYNTIANTHTDSGTPFRGNYAGIGYSYDETNDVFIAPKPFESWTLDQNSWSWTAPVSYPDDDNNYIWNESTESWDLQE